VRAVQTNLRQDMRTGLMGQFRVERAAMSNLAVKFDYCSSGIFTFLKENIGNRLLTIKYLQVCIRFREILPAIRSRVYTLSWITVT